MSLQFQQPFEPQTSVVRGRQVTAHDPRTSDAVLKDSIGGPIFFVDRVARPPEVRAGRPVDVETEVVNAATFVGANDADFCEADTHGFNYEVTVKPEWAAAETRTNCVTITDNRDTQPFNFTAPEPANTTTYDIDVTFRMPGSGNRYSVTRQVVVIGTSEPENGDPVRTDPVDEEENNDTSNGGNGGGSGFLDRLLGGGGGLALGFTGGLLFLVVLLVLLIAIGGE